jgi:hypothetical protein
VNNDFDWAPEDTPYGLRWLWDYIYFKPSLAHPKPDPIPSSIDYAVRVGITVFLLVLPVYIGWLMDTLGNYKPLPPLVAFFTFAGCTAICCWLIKPVWSYYDGRRWFPRY